MLPMLRHEDRERHPQLYILYPLNLASSHIFSISHQNYGVYLQITARQFSRESNLVSPKHLLGTVSPAQGLAIHNSHLQCIKYLVVTVAARLHSTSCSIIPIPKRHYRYCYAIISRNHFIARVCPDYSESSQLLDKSNGNQGIHSSSDRHATLNCCLAL